METPYIKKLRQQYAASIKKAIAKENAKLNNLYKEFSLSVFNEAQNNSDLDNILKSNPKINESFQKLLLAFNDSNLSQDTKTNTKEDK
ncbi:hypothetical protein BKN38_07850 [Helicobacter sp. CLO-3]|uniref:hypothetical protein n=1 Tax=unclassified Helicobacter TaxID=2593540 RepID=UPI0008054071|nr:MULTISPECIES: hypothetical protein [unclassified Helicobacter]OBV28809.1 hypothetical protein BA723_08050 [Helicobacter sp. CLO-3]OHU82056.1 hypothetical protein BKN38_07850 [Helicobacter sp. CLO-3]